MPTTNVESVDCKSYLTGYTFILLWFLQYRGPPRLTFKMSFFISNKINLNGRQVKQFYGKNFE